MIARNTFFEESISKNKNFDSNPVIILFVKNKDVEVTYLLNFVPELSMLRI